MRHVKKHLSAYLHGELDDKTAARVETHLHICDKCRKASEEIRTGAEFAEMLARQSLPEETWQDIRQELLSSNPASPVRLRLTRPNRKPLFAFAGAVCVAAIVWLVFYFDLTGSADIALNHYLDLVERSSFQESLQLASPAVEQFQRSNPQRAIAVAGVAHVSQTVPLTDFRLSEQFIKTVKGQDVVQLVYSKGSESFTVFVAPNPVDFGFDHRKVEPVRIGEIECRKVESPATSTYWFGAGDFQCVLVSQLEDQEKNAEIIRYFVSAHLQLKK
jgi:anti-sigma factor RsiW